MIKLPFVCEEQIIHWETQLFHVDALTSAALGEQQYFCVLCVDDVSVKQVQAHRNRGVMHVVGSPALADHRRAAAQQQQQQPMQQGP